MHTYRLHNTACISYTCQSHELLAIFSYEKYNTEKVYL